MMELGVEFGDKWGGEEALGKSPAEGEGGGGTGGENKAGREVGEHTVDPCSHVSGDPAHICE